MPVDKSIVEQEQSQIILEYCEFKNIYPQSRLSEGEYALMYYETLLNFKNYIVYSSKEILAMGEVLQELRWILAKQIFHVENHGIEVIGDAIVSQNANGISMTVNNNKIYGSYNWNDVVLQWLKTSSLVLRSL